MNDIPWTTSFWSGLIRTLLGCLPILLFCIICWFVIDKFRSRSRVSRIGLAVFAGLLVSSIADSVIEMLMSRWSLLKAYNYAYVAGTGLGIFMSLLCVIAYIWWISPLPMEQKDDSY